MARVLMLTTADRAIDPHSRNDFKRLASVVQFDRFHQHTLVDSPEAADIILFVGSSYEDHRDVRAHPYLRQYRKKCFLYHSNDFVIPFLPGIYVNITKRWYSPRRARTGFYFKVFDLDFISQIPSLANCEYLFCFIGSSQTDPVRKRIMTLKHPRAYLEDTSAVVRPEEKKQSFFMVDYGSKDNLHYSAVLARSKFVLCPRGYACSSWRLFETMKAGRVPVIVSDQWVAPEGPPWETFSIRVRQSDVAQIPRLLEEHESRAEAMGQIARTAWEEWFSRETSFHRIVEWCLQLQQNQRHNGIGEVAPYLQLLRPYFFRHAVLPAIRKKMRSRLPGIQR